MMLLKAKVSGSWGGAGSVFSVGAGSCVTWGKVVGGAAGRSWAGGTGAGLSSWVTGMGTLRDEAGLLSLLGDGVTLRDAVGLLCVDAGTL